MAAPAPTASWTTRPAQTADAPFLLWLYASTRADELALVGWTAEQKAAFMRMQFDMQSRSYRMQFPEAQHDIILSDGVPIGRQIVDRSEGEIHLIDISLLPEHRSRGVGSALLSSLQAEAVQDDKAVRLHVEVTNRALVLYERLGFVKLSSDGLYYAMVWTAPRARLRDE